MPNVIGQCPVSLMQLSGHRVWYPFYQNTDAHKCREVTRSSVRTSQNPHPPSLRKMPDFGVNHYNLALDAMHRNLFVPVWT